MSVRTKLGVWIDHTKAVIVIVSEKGEELYSIQSGPEERANNSEVRQSQGLGKTIMLFGRLRTKGHLRVS
jgi:hypothetical protein